MKYSKKEDNEEGEEGDGGISLCIAIDNSGSMSHRGLDKAAQSLVRSWGNMRRVKEICIFTFDSGPGWVTKNFPSPYDQADIVRKLDNLRAGGGGINVQPALEIAYRSIQAGKYNRNVLLITDLDDSPMIRESAAMAKVAYEDHRVTTHILAIGDQGIYREELKPIAAAGKGVFKEIPKVDDKLAKINWKGIGPPPETYRKLAVTIDKEENSPILRGIPEELPNGRGYARMDAREAATHVLKITRTNEKTGKETDFAGFATWITGKGRVGMLNVGIEHPEAWHNWPYVDKFWSQAIRWAIHPQSADPYLTRVKGSANQVQLYFTRKFSRADAPIPAYVEMRGVEKTQLLPIQLDGENRYKARFVPEQAGKYIAYLVAQDKTPIQSTFCYFPKISQTFSTGESVDFTADIALLEEIAELTGGKLNAEDISLEGGGKAASSEAPAPAFFKNAWMYLLLLALILYWLEIMQRNGTTLRRIKESFLLLGELVRSKVRKNLS